MFSGHPHGYAEEQEYKFGTLKISVIQRYGTKFHRPKNRLVKSMHF